MLGRREERRKERKEKNEKRNIRISNGMEELKITVSNYLILQSETKERKEEGRDEGSEGGRKEGT